MAREPRFAMDMEANGFFHYDDTVSLIQIAIPGAVFLVDPLAVKDLSKLGALMADPKVQKILHGCDYDLRSFDKQYGYHFANLYDTAIATQLMNQELMGLGRALLTYLNVKVEKPVKLQRSDWSRRPIPPGALEYAAGDAAHLLPLRETLDAKLAALGRTEWMVEECALMERIRYEPGPPPEEAFATAKGTFDLEPAELAIYRELYLLRERSAQQVDRPPFKVLSNEALLALARDPDQPFETVPNANRRWLFDIERELRAAIERGRKAPPIMHPSRGKRTRSPWYDEARGRWRTLNDLRQQEAVTLGISASTLWPTRSLENMVLYPELYEQEMTGSSQFGVRRWQRKVFGPALAQAWKFLDGAKPAN